MAQAVRPGPGMRLALRDQDYRFGSGPLLCEIVQVVELVYFDNVPWWHIEGRCANGTLDNRGGWHERGLYVIHSAVRPLPRWISPGRTGPDHVAQ